MEQKTKNFKVKVNQSKSLSTRRNIKKPPPCLNLSKAATMHAMSCRPFDVLRKLNRKAIKFRGTIDLMCMAF
jgi:hypothetical protein